MIKSKYCPLERHPLKTLAKGKRGEINPLPIYLQVNRNTQSNLSNLRAPCVPMRSDRKSIQGYLLTTQGRGVIALNRTPRVLGIHLPKTAAPLLKADMPFLRAAALVSLCTRTGAPIVPGISFRRGGLNATHASCGLGSSFVGLWGCRGASLR